MVPVYMICGNSIKRRGEGVQCDTMCALCNENAPGVRRFNVLSVLSPTSSSAHQFINLHY